jgi:hypothetical protein
LSFFGTSPGRGRLTGRRALVVGAGTRPSPEPDPPDDQPVLPERSEDETGVGWGEAPEPDDEERLRRDRPPHWDQ